jgi:transposase
MIEVFETEGTFDRLKFLDCLRQFALSGKVKPYPAENSVWILDGARIHCDANLIMYLRSMGIVPLFLPAYCPFFNPIEVVFGLVKRYLQATYVECVNKSMSVIVATAFKQFECYNFYKLFRHCGYAVAGQFNPCIAYSHDSGTEQSLYNFTDAVTL